MKPISIITACLSLIQTAVSQTEINTENYIFEYDREYVSHYAMDTTLPHYELGGRIQLDITTPFEVEKSGKGVVWNFEKEVFTYPWTYDGGFGYDDTFRIYSFIQNPMEAPSSPYCANCNEDADFVMKEIPSSRGWTPYNPEAKVVYYLFNMKTNNDIEVFGSVDIYDDSLINGNRLSKPVKKNLPYYFGHTFYSTIDTTYSKSLPGAKEFVIRYDYYGIDGQGTLLLPYGKVEGAIKLTGLTIDILRRHYDNGNVTTDTQDVWGVYKWYHPFISGGIPIVEGYYKHVYYQAQHTRPHRFYFTYMLKEESIKEEMRTLGLYQQEKELPHLLVYPVPTGHILHWQRSEDTRADLRITDLRGVEVLRSATMGNTGSLDIHFLSPGIYFLHITDGEKTTGARFIKN